MFDISFDHKSISVSKLTVVARVSGSDYGLIKWFIMAQVELRWFSLLIRWASHIQNNLRTFLEQSLPSFEIYFVSDIFCANESLYVTCFLLFATSTWFWHMVRFKDERLWLQPSYNSYNESGSFFHCFKKEVHPLIISNSKKIIVKE